MKYLLPIILFILILYVAPKLEVKTKQTKATSEKIKKTKIDLRERKVSLFLRRNNSPLADEATAIVTAADRNHLDYRLIPAIAGKESTFCKYYLIETFNCWGWGSGRILFLSLADAIHRISFSLAANYDTSSVRSIAYRYCPPKNSKGEKECDTEKWIADVTYFENQIDDQKP